jgi:hypothetical protein
MSFRLASGGARFGVILALQLLRITRMRALAGDGRADWVSYWASLTFEVARDGPSTAPAVRRSLR